jgi:hypothetical protein
MISVDRRLSSYYHSFITLSVMGLKGFVWQFSDFNELITSPVVSKERRAERS